MRIENKKILEGIFYDALKDLGITGAVYSFTYERIGGRFKSIENSCEVSGTTIYVNEDWAEYCVVEYKYDLSFIMAHEARHVYQQNEVMMYRNNGTYCEGVNRIELWAQEFQHYIRNIGPQTFEAHSKQDVEIDANAYAALFCMLRGEGQPRFASCVDKECTERFIELAERKGLTVDTRD